MQRAACGWLQAEPCTGSTPTAGVRRTASGRATRRLPTVHSLTNDGSAISHVNPASCTCPNQAAVQAAAPHTFSRSRSRCERTSSACSRSRTGRRLSCRPPAAAADADASPGAARRPTRRPSSTSISSAPRPGVSVARRGATRRGVRQLSRVNATGHSYCCGGRAGRGASQRWLFAGTRPAADCSQQAASPSKPLGTLGAEAFDQQGWRRCGPVRRGADAAQRNRLFRAGLGVCRALLVVRRRGRGCRALGTRTATHNPARVAPRRKACWPGLAQAVNKSVRSARRILAQQ
eukprot:352832-Chlamydomonas_euryale.AAC.3